MGKQIAFYSTPSDEAAFIEDMTSRLGVRLIRGAFQRPEEMEVPTLPVVEGVPPRGVEYLLYHPLFKNSLLVKSFETGANVVNQSDSLIVQMSRSFIMGSVIFNGRLWYEPSLTDGTEKPGEFISWAESVFATIRSRFEFREERGRCYFVGPDVISRVRQGQLQLR